MWKNILCSSFEHSKRLQDWGSLRPFISTRPFLDKANSKGSNACGWERPKPSPWCRVREERPLTPHWFARLHHKIKFRCMKPSHMCSGKDWGFCIMTQKRQGRRFNVSIFLRWDHKPVFTVMACSSPDFHSVIGRIFAINKEHHLLEILQSLYNLEYYTQKTITTCQISAVCT